MTCGPLTIGASFLDNISALVRMQFFRTSQLIRVRRCEVLPNSTKLTRHSESGRLPSPPMVMGSGRTLGNMMRLANSRHLA